MQILDFKHITNGTSPLKASFRVHIPEWGLNIIMMYFLKYDGKSWFGYPSREYTGAEGEKKYQWLTYFDEKAKVRFETALKKELQKFLGEQPKEQELEDEIPF